MSKINYFYTAGVVFITFVHVSFVGLHEGGVGGLLSNSFRSNPERREKIKLNFYFHTSWWCFKKFYEGLKGLHKTFYSSTNKWENKNLT